MALCNDRTRYFAERSEDGRINYWPRLDNPFAEELRTEGVSRADALVNVMRGDNGQPITLKFVAEAIAEGGVFGTMEAAFFHRIGELLTA